MENRRMLDGGRAARGLLRLALAGVTAAAACLPGPVGADVPPDSGRLRSRPGVPVLDLAPGRHALGLGGDRDGVLFVPSSYRPGSPAPFVLFLHGAGGSAQRLDPLLELAEEAGTVILLPESRGRTWDGVAGRFDVDVAFLDRALSHAFERLAIDQARLAIAGFSDGGSYALSLGLANGDLFSHVLAFAPGFIDTPGRTGKPPVFIAHGTQDAVLPIAATSRRIVPALRAAGYAVTYREFEGPHVVSLRIVREALAWMNG